MSISSRSSAPTVVEHVLNPARRIDYLLLALVGALPWPLAQWLHVWRLGDLHPALSCLPFSGYRDKAWPWFVLILPIALYCLRRVTATAIPPVGAPPAQRAPIIQILIDQARGGGPQRDHDAVAADLRAAMMTPRNLYIALGLATFINLVDVREVLGHYVVYLFQHQGAQAVREPDWTVYFLTGQLDVWWNLLLIFVAYALQWLAIAIAMLLVVMFLRHNLFFLTHIFQKRWSEVSESQDAPDDRLVKQREDQTIVINSKDRLRCFGLQAGNPAFNAQVRCLAIGGILLLFSRYANVPSSCKPETAAIDPAFSIGDILKVLVNAWGAGGLRDIGQVVIVLGWLAFLLVVMLPAAVKFLPFFSRSLGGIDVVFCLRQFLPKAVRGVPEHADDGQIDEICKEMARNAFWPSGNRPAFVWFALASFVFFVMLFPVVPSRGQLHLWFVFQGMLLAVAVSLTVAAFKLVRAALAYVDPRLVDDSGD